MNKVSMNKVSVSEKVTCDLSAWREKWKGRREGLVMQAALMEIQRLRQDNSQLQYAL